MAKLKEKLQKKIENWRQEQRERITREKRPDLYEKYKKNIKIK